MMIKYKIITIKEIAQKRLDLFQTMQRNGESILIGDYDPIHELTKLVAMLDAWYYNPGNHYPSCYLDYKDMLLLGFIEM